MTRGVSVVVCCFNSASRIRDTLCHLARLEAAEDLSVEVVLVDNASTDNTRSIARNHWDELGDPFPLVIVAEPHAGLSNARIQGIKAASNEIVIFCDDDNWLNPDYANVSIAIMGEHADVAIAGGRTEAAFESPGHVPPWFFAISGSYAVGGDAGAGFLTGGDIVWGAGMVCRRRVLLQLLHGGFTFMSSDRKGGTLTAGGDAELCQAIQLTGYRIYHDGRLQLRHFIPEARLTWNYAIRLGMGFGAATITVDAQRVFAHPEERFKNFVRKSFAYQMVRASLAILPHLKSVAKLSSAEGDLANLAVAPKLGRWLAIAKMNRSYRRIIRDKVAWMRTTLEKKGQLAVDQTED